MSRSRSARERREGRVGGRTDGRKKGRTDERTCGREDVWRRQVAREGAPGRAPRRGAESWRLRASTRAGAAAAQPLWRRRRAAGPGAGGRAACPRSVSRWPWAKNSGGSETGPLPCGPGGRGAVGRRREARRDGTRRGGTGRQHGTLEPGGRRGLGRRAFPLRRRPAAACFGMSPERL